MLRIAFCDFWPGFDPGNNFVTEALEDEWILSDEPDVLFFSCFGDSHKRYRHCLKVQYLGENVRPNFAVCDYSISFDLSSYGGRNLRWPLYNLYYDPRHSAAPEDRPEFCCMVVSNPGNELRGELFTALGRYKRVDSGGRFLNNVGGPVTDKMAFLRRYRFCLCLENSSYPGYTTEKLLQAKVAGCVPIYWGNPQVELDFDLESFIDLGRLASMREWVAEVAANEEDPFTFGKMQTAPLLRNNEYTEYSDPRVLRRWLNTVVRDRTRRRSWRIFAGLIDRRNRALTRRYDRQAKQAMER